jgi:hypothetical protein
VPVTRIVILLACVGASVGFGFMLETWSDRASVIAFAVCIAVSVGFDWLQAHNREKHAKRRAGRDGVRRVQG